MPRKPRVAPKPHILLIDDDMDLNEMNKVVLEANGFDVTVAFSGEEGLKKAAEHLPDLIVLDVMMDYKTEGFHVTYDLRQVPGLKSTPILMLTAINREDFIGRFQPDPTWLPVDQLLDKPLSPQLLLAEIKKTLHGSA
jgi:DNA-binding response OmpR family regulator